MTIPGPYDVELANGGYFNVLTGEGAKPTLDDIATCLAKTCRYGGACAGFYSVAEHAVLVAEKLGRMGEPAGVQIAGLHHDDAEFCLADVMRPVKNAIGQLEEPGGGSPYVSLENRVYEVIWDSFLGDVRMAVLHCRPVKLVDQWACRFEARRLMPSKGEGWEDVWLPESLAIEDDPRDEIYCWGWEDARVAYLATHHRLAREITQVAA